MKLGEMTAEQRREQIRKVAKRMGLYRETAEHIAAALDVVAAEKTAPGRTLQ